MRDEIQNCSVANFFFFFFAVARCLPVVDTVPAAQVLDTASCCHVVYLCPMTSLLRGRFHWMHTVVQQTREQNPVAHSRPISCARISSSPPTARPYVNTPLAIGPWRTPPFGCIWYAILSLQTTFDASRLPRPPPASPAPLSATLFSYCSY